MEKEELKEWLFGWAAFAKESATRAKSKNIASHITHFREGQQSMIELLICDAGLQEEFEKWSKEHEKN